MNNVTVRVVCEVRVEKNWHETVTLGRSEQIEVGTLTANEALDVLDRISVDATSACRKQVFRSRDVAEKSEPNAAGGENVGPCDISAKTVAVPDNPDDCFTEPATT